MSKPARGTQEWFEMADLRRRRVADQVWIPIRRSKPALSTGRYGERGYLQEFHGDGTVALPTEAFALGAKLNWGDVGLARSHAPVAGSNQPYVPSDVFLHDDVKGVHLVLEQVGVAGENVAWHLHQDLVLALGLRRERDSWVSPDEGFEVVARMERHDDGSPAGLFIRAEHLRDYLAARGMGLCVTSYRSRRAVLEEDGHIDWTDEKDEDTEGETWEGRVWPIHEGGMPFGEKAAVFHVGRTDVDEEEDVPNFDEMDGDNFASHSATFGVKGEKLFVASGELWRTEWIDPGSSSPRVRGDLVKSDVTFAVEADGARLEADSLRGARCYLWFRPEVGMALSSVRGGGVLWHTRETGTLWGSPDYKVTFGVNKLGLVTVFAKDVATLPEWQKRRWAAENVTPNGGVSEELLVMQMKGEWLDTFAAEQRLREALSAVATAGKTSFGIDVFEEHKERSQILERTHRLRATSREKLLELAKDLARLTADSLSPSSMASVLPPLLKGQTRGSLKSLEKLLCEQISPDDARSAMSNLFYIYDTRISDAHLPNSKAVEALAQLGCSADDAWVHQGERVISACAESLERIAEGLGSNRPADADS